ncbi:ABC transporter permease [Fictibacillus phosphorivorans]|uniref:ABC transporter permease n=1 Tax=Fictibacillus phosphorivorans TaxID=1221500 RepID=UPI001293242C|nr:ABC transporter permease [Fictibacillus phosphorivorans]MQR96188.1 ABC transporter permease [Fictibacillus phosphorivorans]
MRNSWKVAKWELKRNMKNKSFIISLLLTPLLFIVFASFPTLLEKLEGEPDSETVTVYVNDELNLFDEVNGLVKSQDLSWKMEEVTDDSKKILKKIESSENQAYVALTDDAVKTGEVKVFTSNEMPDTFSSEVQFLQEPLRQVKFDQLNLSPEVVQSITKGIEIKSEEALTQTGSGSLNPSDKESADDSSMERIIPGAFAGIVLFSIVMTGMMIFQSASQEKKEKVAEIVLSSVTPGDLMQGKIIGYFILGLVQVGTWLLLVVPIAAWRYELPIAEYLFVPELLLLLAISIAGYLMFAAIFVGIGATVEDMTATSNFQGIVMMLPFLPLIFLGPILANPSGIIAQVATYFPLTSPSILILRLSLLDEWPWVEIIIALVILLASIWLLMKLAGKVFKTGILLYGKNATPSEIWKWLRY